MEDMRTMAGPAAKFDWRSISLFLITLGVLVVCVWMVRPFLPAIMGAIVLAVATHRPYAALKRRIRDLTLAASLATASVTLCIIVPALFVIQLIAQYATRAAYALQDGSLEKIVSECLNGYPRLATLARHSSELLTISHAAEKAAGFIATSLVTVLGNSFATLTQVIIALFILFFLYRDERVVLRYFARLLPLSGKETDELLTRIDETIRATVLGTFVVAGIQGLLSGIIFAVLGVSNPALLGVLVTIAAVIPYFGAYVVWFPVALYLAMTGHWIAALVLLVVGSIVISSLDNFLYPVLVGAQLRQHPVTVLVSLLGGIWLFGISGLIVGPVLFSVADSLLAVWRSRLIEVGLPSEYADPIAARAVAVLVEHSRVGE